jgi:hypothetical protein
MKKALLLFLCIFLIPVAGRSDVIPVGSHVVIRDVVISNIRSFPDISVIAYIKGPMIQSYEVNQVQENIPINLGYKFNTLNIFIVKNTYITNSNGINNINFDSLAPTYLNADFLAPYMSAISDDQPLVYEKITYVIQGTTDTALTLHISERLLRFNDGTPDVVESY